MRKKLITIIFVSILSILLLTACPPKNGPNGDETEVATELPTEEITEVETEIPIETEEPVERDFLLPLLCYSLEPSIWLENPIIHTMTQFGEEWEIMLDSQFMLCEPVSKTHEAEVLEELPVPMLNPLICYYALNSDEMDVKVRLHTMNELYSGDAYVWKYSIFCDPVESKIKEWGDTIEREKFPFPLLFYDIEPIDEFREEQVIFTRDQFVDWQLILGHPTYLAEPVYKIHGEERILKDPPEDVHPHLCFDIMDFDTEDPEVENLHMPVIIEDQFHDEPFEVFIDRPVMFCDPTEKTH